MNPSVIIVQPPLLQLNTASPSGAYLSAFFREAGLFPKWDDLSIALFNSIFSKDGLKKLFDLSAPNALKVAEKAQREGDKETAFQIRRYVETKESWQNWIEPIKSILRGNTGGSREFCHRFIYSPFAPRGHRMEQFLSGLEREPCVDDAPFLASMALADLSDYIAVAFDKEFSLVRYAESLCINESSFSDIQKGLEKNITHPSALP